MNLKKIMAAAMCVVSVSAANASDDFNRVFNDSTLRVDYIFGGGPNGLALFLDSQSKTAGWAGRRNNLKEVPLQGNGRIEVVDPKTGDVLYKHSFSSLFQEWLHTPEASTTPRSFENTFLLPLPKDTAEIVVTLLDNRNNTLATLKHLYDPADELVRTRRKTGNLVEYIHKGGDPQEVIDVAMLAEGYTPEEREAFLEHAKRMAEEILSYEPFKSRKDRFNFVAVLSPSPESGVSVPLEEVWPETAFNSHYSTFHSPRYLTSPNVKKMHDALTGVPYEHIIILVNTERYGGGGIYNSYQMAATRNEHSLPVTVHEFGHSFGGLADEYFYTDEEDETYALDVEPWEPNITTLVDFSSKWEDMVTPGTPIPTPSESEQSGGRGEKMKRDKKNAKSAKTDKGPVVGAFEGGGYKSKGVYRPVETCRMRDNYYPAFCPVCEASLTRLIDFYTAK